MFGLRPAALLLSVALLSLLASGCSDAREAFVSTTKSVAAPIVGGELTGESDFPAVVALGGCSGTLVHPELVVYAAHCGTAISSLSFGPHADAPERVAMTDRCRSFPGATLGDGTDLAYCVLEEPVLDLEPERILSGCELDELMAGEPAIIVGYGKDSDEGAYGEKRFAHSSLESIGDELFLEQGSSDTCRGDSGGPVFVERPAADGTVQRRLIGVTSAGTESACGRGVGHYVNVARKLDWLETSSQLDLTPCFEQGEWSPTAACRATGTAERDASLRPLLDTCGDPFDQPEDLEAPSVAWMSPAEASVRLPLPVGAEFVELELAVDAADTGAGVEHVEISLLASGGEVLFHRGDEIPPYGLPTLRVPPGHFLLLAEARDFSGNSASAGVALRVGDEPAGDPAASGGGGGCATTSRAAPRGTGLMTMLALLCAFATRRPMKGRR
ncbi:MAG TPA: S1 family peptidase [Polyangiaceae bacterium]